VFENSVLRRIFGPKMEEVTENLRKLHIEELSDLHISPNFFGWSYLEEWIWPVLQYVCGRWEIHTEFLRNPKRKKPFGRPRLRWEYNIEIYFRDVELRHGVDWGVSSYVLAARTCECSIKSVNFLSMWETVCF
jgi:hypothetical protein